jgi:hypothetical protein
MKKWFRRLLRLRRRTGLRRTIECREWPVSRSSLFDEVEQYAQQVAAGLVPLIALGWFAYDRVLLIQ